MKMLSFQVQFILSSFRNYKSENGFEKNVWKEMLSNLPNP